jgi:hypothetical protein
MAGVLAACIGVCPPNDSCGSSAQPSGMIIAYFMAIPGRKTAQNNTRFCDSIGGTNALLSRSPQTS